MCFNLSFLTPALSFILHFVFIFLNKFSEQHPYLILVHCSVDKNIIQWFYLPHNYQLVTITATRVLFFPAELSTVICDNKSKAEILLQNREKGQTPLLKNIVIMDPFNSDLVEQGAKCGVDIVLMKDVEVKLK